MLEETKQELQKRLKIIMAEDKKTFSNTCKDGQSQQLIDCKNFVEYWKPFVDLKFVILPLMTITYFRRCQDPLTKNSLKTSSISDQYQIMICSMVCSIYILNHACISSKINQNVLKCDHLSQQLEKESVCQVISDPRNIIFVEYGLASKYTNI